MAIYEQIVTQVEENVLNGLLKSGEQLPSVRALSLELALNPNTVSKAYTELERRGIIFTAVGKGCFIADGARSVIAEKYASGFEELEKILKKYKAAGVGRERLSEVIDRVFGEDEK